MAGNRFVYVTYIRSTPEKLWDTLTNTDFIPLYWGGNRIESEWRVGASWQLIMADGRVGDQGEIEAFDPPSRLQLRWRNEWIPELAAEGYSTWTIELEPVGDAVKLTLVHEISQAESKFIDAVSGGWPQILSNLKSLVETGAIAVTPRRVS